MRLLEWDAKAYDALPLPHTRWGAGTIHRLPLAGNETVVELGCGTGRDTEHLLERLPHGRVIAVDGSVQMLAGLRRRLAGRMDRVTVVQADLRYPWTLDEPADAALSVATLHWLPDHDVVFQAVAAALRPGGRFVAECGGTGSVEGFRAAVRAAGGDDGARLWNFAGVEETTHRLQRAGFTGIEVELVADTAVLERGEQLDAYLATVMLGAQLRELPPERHHQFVREVAQRLPEPVIDYVRLHINATRAEPRAEH
jgi:trans-aconitate 2-methyltransferase